MYSRSLNYFKRNAVFEQQGVLAVRSVETNLCSFLNYFMPVVHIHGQKNAIYFNICKACDKVNHLLMSKSKNYRIGPQYITWFRRYLHKGQNCVRVSC